MCGICGYWSSSNPVDQPTLDRMNQALRHRGPDSAGKVLLGQAGLAMSRLSIIDVATGQQPIANEDQTRWIVCNGEIYNFPELRRDLEARGHRFRTRSDSEVALHAYEEWGLDFVDKLRGMFGLAIWDGAAPRLVLARDPLGKKPLYYYRDPQRLLFASEIKALLAHPEVPRRVHRDVIPLYLAHGYIPAPDTAFEGIWELPPGHMLTARDGEIAVREYWDVKYSTESRPRNLGEAIVELRRLLREAVRKRLLSDVPLGAFLSGGLDSTAIVALMTELTNRPVKTFSIGFEDDPSFNETQFARLAARAFKTEHHEFLVRPDAVELLHKLVWHYDQPFADSSALPTYLLAQRTRQHVTVALSGDGGDELFAGYERFAAARLGETYRRTVPAFLHSSILQLLRACPESTAYHGFVRRARRFAETAPLPLPERYLGLVGIFQNGFLRDFSCAGRDPVAHFRECFAPVESLDPLSQLLYVNTKTYLAGDLLVKADRMSMANSLEVRSPFLDRDLVAFAAGLPPHWKLRGLTTKRILKKAVTGLAPDAIIHRRKHGFGVPVGRWLRGPLRSFAREMLLSKRALSRDYFRPEAVRQLIEEHQSGQRDHGHRLWALLTLEIWHETFID